MDTLIVTVPQKYLDESGVPLQQPVVDIIHAMSVVGWGVIDFGEAGETHTELHFEQCGFSLATGMAKHFIDCGGDV